MSEEFASQYCTNMVRPGTKPEEFKNKHIALTNNRNIVAGVHFLGLDVDKQFF